jgi:hypothetical protein
MHSVCETKAFESAAKDAGMSREEVDALTDFIALNPDAGDEIEGAGGCRKVRVSGRGKGKSGGYRVVTFFTGPKLPIFLITVFGKGERSNLTKAEQNGLAKLTKILVSEYSKKVVGVRKKKEAST